MALVLVVGEAEGAGASTVAAGLAHRAAHTGRAVSLYRLEGDDRAGADAEAFGRLAFSNSPGQPVAIDAIPRDGDVTIVEAGAGADAASLASTLGAKIVEVGRGESGRLSAAKYLQNHAVNGGSLRVAEDRVLAGPTVGAIIAASGARVIARSDAGEQASCDHIVIGAISHDPDAPYFGRFSRPAVVTRSEKVDIGLAAMSVAPVCLLLTGGNEPSPYLIDRFGASRDTTVLLAPGDTVETLGRIQGSFGTSPFAGDEKAERIGSLLATAVDEGALASLIGTPAA
jgi:BioD-like phosphotransacetylase family protein